uniref:methenyltetrahydrofolate cyclohydrolase n=1 Tax=Opuntia streptacantha TaxID=393608 RepID=A0A7C9AIX9_OPUST
MWAAKVSWWAIRKRACSSFSSSWFSSSPSIPSHSGRLASGSVRYLGLDLPDAWPCALHSQPSPKPHIDRRASIIDGKSIGAMVKSQVAAEILRMKDSIGKQPGLAVVLVGKRNDSHSFVRIKMKACHEVGIASSAVELPADCTEDEVIHVISNLNNDPSIHGVIVQLPLPKHLDGERVLNDVKPEKDVDGFHPLNMGSLAMKGREPFFIPCAAKGCIELLLRCGVEMLGKNAVVIGRSKIVGLPASLLLQVLKLVI